MLRPLLIAVLLVACNKGKDPANIEITGYLDAARISATSAEDPTVMAVPFAVVGEPGAVGDLAAITVRNKVSGDMVETDVSVDGSFVAVIDAIAGEGLAVEGPEGVQAVSFSVQDHPPFPDHVAITPHAPDADGLVQVTVELANPHPDLDLVLGSPHGSAAVHLEPGGTGDVHWSGHIPGQSGDTLWLHALNPNHEPTRAVELAVP